jgi:hypothetical protein
MMYASRGKCGTLKHASDERSIDETVKETAGTVAAV